MSASRGPRRQTIAIDNRFGSFTRNTRPRKTRPGDRAASAEAGEPKTPALGLGGTSSFVLPIAAEMLGEVASDVRVGAIPEFDHGIAGGNPAALLDGLFHRLG